MMHFFLFVSQECTGSIVTLSYIFLIILLNLPLLCLLFLFASLPVGVSRFLPLSIHFFFHCLFSFSSPYFTFSFFYGSVPHFHPSFLFLQLFPLYFTSGRPGRLTTCGVRMEGKGVEWDLVGRDGTGRVTRGRKRQTKLGGRESREA